MESTKSDASKMILPDAWNVDLEERHVKRTMVRTAHIRVSKISISYHFFFYRRLSPMRSFHTSRRNNFISNRIASSVVPVRLMFVQLAVSGVLQ